MLFRQAAFYSAVAIFSLGADGRASVFPKSPFTDQAAGTTAAAFLNSPPGARGEALGESYAAVADNSEAVFWNPAGIASLQPIYAKHPMQNALQSLAAIGAKAAKIGEKIRTNLATIDFQKSFTGRLRDELEKTRKSMADIAARMQSAGQITDQEKAVDQLQSALNAVAQIILERIGGFAKADNSGQGDARGAFLSNYAAEAQSDLEALLQQVRDESERLRNSSRRMHQTAGPANDVSSNFDALLAGSFAGSLAYAHDAGDLGVFGTGLSYFSAGAIQGYNVTGDQTSSFSPNDFSLGVYYANRVRYFEMTPGLKLGGGIKLIRSSIAEASGTGFAADVGMQIEHMVDFGELPLDLGLGLRNLGPAMSVGGAADPLPFTAQGGFLWHLSPNVNGVLDGHMPVNNSPYVSVGLEGNFTVNGDIDASVRAGYNMKNTRGVDGSLTGMAAGVGVVVDGFRLDYAWIPFGNLGFTNRITLGCGF